MHVAGLGVARNNDPAALFTYDLSITDFNPKQGSYGGKHNTVFVLITTYEPVREKTNNLGSNQV